MPRDRRPIRQRLMAYYTALELELWLHRPHPQLLSLAPYQLIDAGHAELVHRVIDRLDADAYV